MITSAANPFVKQARALRQRKARTESGLFLVEGIHPVAEAIEAGWEIEVILFAPEILTSQFAHDMISQVPAISHSVSVHVLESVAGRENPQGILAVVRQKRAQLADVTVSGFAVAVISPQDPGNVGTILRTLDAVGGEALFLLDGGVDPYNPSSVRASMGALFWIPVVEILYEELISWARRSNRLLIGSSAHAELNYREFQPDRPWLLLLGNEQKGLTSEQLSACEVTVSVPMKGRASSLNLAVAAGVLLYQLADNS